jgi:hypothetical protein
MVRRKQRGKAGERSGKNLSLEGETPVPEKFAKPIFRDGLCA